MRCPKCRSEVFNDEQFCRYCGERLTAPAPQIQNQSDGNAVPGVAPQNTQPNTQTASTQYNYQVSQMYASSESDILLDAYLGKNAEAFKQNKFNFPMFFLGVIYLFYRKMYLYAFGILVISMITSVFLQALASLISTIITIYLSINFGKLYISHAKEQIAKIKEKNPNASTEQLVEIARRKGGTTIWAPILYFLNTFALVFAIAFIFIFGSYDDIKDQIEESVEETNKGATTNTMEMLSYTIPTNFVLNYETDDYKSYYDDITGETCNFAISILDVTKYTQFETYDSADDYINYMINYESGEVTKDTELGNINGTQWATVQIKSSYDTQTNYAALKDNILYEVEYHVYSDEAPNCDSAFNNFMSSLEFK